jgi:hypothetical protein
MSMYYLVKCPHAGCDWFGHVPSSPAIPAGRNFAASVSIVAFQCPRCQQSWQGRVIGDDVESLPLNEWNNDMETVTWPFVDLGVSG